MASLIRHSSCLCFCLLTLAASEPLGLQSLPMWLQGLFPTPLAASDGAIPNNKEEAFGSPESLLLKQLKSVDAILEPEKARAMHAAIANILRADGRPTGAVPHLEAARDAAERLDEADAILDARLELAQAYIEVGRPQDVENELESTNRLLSLDNFEEYSFKLDRVNGRASFELGSIQLALEFFQEAARIADGPEDIVRCACDVAIAEACLGRAQRSLDTLRNALKVLDSEEKANTIPAALRKTLTTEVHTRLAEAFHSMGDTVSAKKHYDQTPSLKPKKHIRRNSPAQRLRCPGGARTQQFQIPSHTDAGQAFKVKISSLLKTSSYRKAEYELWNYLETQHRPYKSFEATTALLTLGELYTRVERQNYLKAAHCFLKALQASLSCCGARSPEAKDAFAGLSRIEDMLPPKDRAAAASAMQEYRSAAEKLSTSASDLGDILSV